MAFIFTFTPTEIGDPDFANVELLLPLDGDVIDITGNHTVTNNGGTFQTDNFGQVIDLDGGTDHLRMTSTSGLDMESGDFTIECWVKFTALAGSGFQVFINKSLFNSNTALTYFIDFKNSGTEWRFFVHPTNVNTFGFATTIVQAVTLDQWYHVAGVKDGTDIQLFLDGVGSTPTTMSTATINDSPTHDLFIGRSGPTNQNREFNGRIDDVRITKGVARYTANFDVPTEAFPIS